MPVSIRQLHPVFVGEVSGVDLQQPLTRDDAVAIDAGMDHYAVAGEAPRCFDRDLLRGAFGRKDGGSR